MLVKIRPTARPRASRRHLCLEAIEARRPLAADLAPIVDMNASQAAIFASPANLYGIGSSMFYRGNLPSTGGELWVSDGTEAGTRLVKDIFSGTYSSNPRYFTNFNGNLYFVASDGTHGDELWKSDGTAAGTVLVKDINPGTGSSAMTQPVMVGNKLFFVANSSVATRRLWQTDGTEAGTSSVSNENTNILSSMADVNGVLYFVGQDLTNPGGPELWRSDGTPSGTFGFVDISPSGNANPSNLTNVNGTLFFSASPNSQGSQIWKSDGTATGTVLVKDIQPTSNSPQIDYFTTAGGLLFFVGNNGTDGRELWRSDGTTAGTFMVKDIRAGGLPSNPKFLTPVGDRVFFQAAESNFSKELFVSDGTTTGTFMIKRINANSYASPQYLLNANGTLYFSANDGSSGRELWKSNGTAVGTVMVKDVSGSLDPKNLASVNGVVFMSAGIFPELWTSDGTDAGTQLLKDLTGTSSSPIQFLTNVNGAIFFSSVASNTTVLFKTDGTATGTVTVQGSNPSVLADSPQQLTNVNGALYFSAAASAELWKSDGTPGGTVPIKDIWTSGSANPSNFTSVSGTLFFTAYSDSGLELWKSDGTAAGTVLVKDVMPGAGSSSPTLLTNVGGVLFFVADDGINGTELWKSDGTSAGTVLVKNICSGSSSSNLRYLTNAGGILYFSASGDNFDTELWRSDGSEAGTTQVTNINVDGSSFPRDLVSIGSNLYFFATESAHGFELWRTDGTAGGTWLVSDIRPGSAGANQFSFQPVNIAGTLYFRADNGVNGMEVWKSNGTSSGTVMVQDVWPGAMSSTPNLLASSSGVLYFTANDGVNGTEVWKSDGTAAGTQMVENTSGSGGSDPSAITSNGSQVFYVATTDSYGTELHRVQGPPQLSAPVQVGGSGPQRSNVQQLVLNFNSAVTIQPGAFVVQQRTVSGGAVVLTPVTTQVAASTNADGTTRATLSFSGPLVRSNGYLSDGNYLMTIFSANIRRNRDNEAFDGDSDGNAGGNYVFGDDEEENFFALFGDTDGDRLVSTAEFGQLRSAFGKAAGDSAYNSLLDFDGDNAISVVDFGQFRSRFGQPRMALFQDTPVKLDYSRDSFMQSMGMSSSPWARVTYDTDATRLTVTVNASYSYEWANNIGVYIDGVFLKTVGTVFESTTQGTVIIDLPAGLKRVTLQNGPANRNVNLIEGSYIQSVRANRNITRVIAPADNVLVVLGDSIATGASATNLHEDGWGQRLRGIGQQVAFETYGARSLYDDAATPAARAATVQKLTQYAPARIWIALGTNDYSGGRWSPAEFQLAMRALLQDIHTAMPNVSIYLASSLVVLNETRPVNGYINQDFRNATQSAADGLSYVTYINGQPILQLSDLVDGVHPSTEGHLKLFNYNRAVLGV